MLNYTEENYSSIELLLGLGFGFCCLGNHGFAFSFVVSLRSLLMVKHNLKVFCMQDILAKA